MAFLFAGQFMTDEVLIAEILDSIVEPTLDYSGKEMGLRYNIDVKATRVDVVITCGFPTLLLDGFYRNQALNELAKKVPGKQINLSFNALIRAHKTQLVGKSLRGVKKTIAVASGKGGVGKSTVTVNIAAALAQLGARVGILDADIYGPSIPMMLGTRGPVTISDDFYLPIQAHGLQTMSIGYLTDMEHALIWRGPMLAKSLIQMLDGTWWDELDYLFIDLPPGTGDIQLTLAQKIPITAAIVVTTPQNVATLDAQKALTLFAKTGIDVLGVIENMSIHQCSHCGHEEAIFGSDGAKQLCINHHCTLLGQLPLNTTIRQHCDKGIPSASQLEQAIAQPFINTAMNAAIKLAQKPINYSDKFPKIVIE